MSISQFDDTLRRSATQAERVGHIRIDVGGPLRLDPGVVYTKPFAVQFEVIQSPEDPTKPDGIDHDPAHAKRASGAISSDGTGGRWEGHVEVEPGFFRNGEARGVGVAVLPQRTDAAGKGAYSIETITWCDHITLEVDGESGT
jgi:hypothetical protein